MSYPSDCFKYEARPLDGEVTESSCCRRTVPVPLGIFRVKGALIACFPMQTPSDIPRGQERGEFGRFQPESQGHEL